MYINDNKNAFRENILQEEKESHSFRRSIYQKALKVLKAENWNRIRTGLLTATAVMLIMSAAMGSAWAYFTTYAIAKGGVTINLGHEDKIKESYSQGRKSLTITSEEDSNPVYLRARGYSAEYALSYSGTNWEDGGDGWWYYDGVLEPRPEKTKDEDLKVPNGIADTLYVDIAQAPSGSMSGVKDKDTYNVIVVYESTEVQYDEKGNLIPSKKADWNREVDTRKSVPVQGGDE